MTGSPEPLVLYLSILSIALSVLLRHTDSLYSLFLYPFGIFKLFLQICIFTLIITETTDILKWVPVHDSRIPSNAIKCGQEADGRPLFVARAMYNGFLYPGKAGYHFNGCRIGCNWQEIEYSKYDVLTIPADSNVILTWEKDFCGHVPENSVRVDPSWQFYVGRHDHNGGLCPGRIDCWNKSIFITNDGKEHQYNNYEVLVATESNPSVYKLHNVRYDLDKAKIKMGNSPLLIASQPASNSSDHDSHIGISVSYSKTTSHNWIITGGFKLGSKLEVSGSIPFFANANFSLSPEISFSGSTGHTVQENVSASADASVKLPPNSSVNVVIVARKQEIEVPYTSSITKIMSDGRQHTAETDGVYHGVTFTDFQTSIENTASWV